MTIAVGLIDATITGELNMAKKPENGKEFQDLLGKLVRVPKEEVDKEMKAERRRKRRRKK